MMASIEDWAAKAARRIVDEYDNRKLPRKDQDHIAAIIATFAEPLVVLLQEARHSHSRGWNEESADYPPCPLSDEDAKDLGMEKCTCGAGRLEQANRRGIEVTREEYVEHLERRCYELADLLRESRREHDQDGQGCFGDEEPGTCICGADAWNARVDAALAGGKVAP